MNELEESLKEMDPDKIERTLKAIDKKIPPDLLTDKDKESLKKAKEIIESSKADG